MEGKAIMYVVRIHQGVYENYNVTNKFVTGSKEQAYLWADKFNKIMDANKQRFYNYSSPEGYHKLWSDMFINGESDADVEEIEYRW